MLTKKRPLAVLMAVLSLVSLAIGILFLYEGFAQTAVLAQAMQQEKITYNSDGIVGVIDTPDEAATMASVLKEHRENNFGLYTELKRDDPNRQQVLNAMTMENALNLAQLGFGVTTVIKAIGAFMVVVAAGFAVLAAALKPGPRPVAVRIDK